MEQINSYGEKNDNFQNNEVTEINECTNLSNVLTNIQKALTQTNLINEVSLLAVTKQRSIEEIRSLYKEGQLLFGESYLNELEKKAAVLPNEIEWFFIGHLQSNKCKKLLQINNMTTILTVDSLNLALTLNKECEKLTRTVDIYIQINISNEDSKSGCDISDTLSLYQSILTDCPNLKLKGLMSLGTVGSINEFEKMYELKLQIFNELKLDLSAINLSFGTSSDYTLAIQYGGANLVRVGSNLFSN